ncbi:MAG: DUF4115 domain-containing protein [Methylobacillus sp.]|jgi:cytoskeleton protein RodZ|nr:DUF4115 domain-containing protein [Methylobacillus sp.]
MSDQEQEQTPEQTASSPALSLEEAGRVLTEAREKMGLSVAEASARMRLTIRQVEAMESGNLDALPGPTFVRGFLRNYARLLQIDAVPLLEAYQLHGVKAAPGELHIHSENIQIKGRKRKSLIKYFVGILLLVALLLAAWMAYKEFVADEKSKPSAQSAEPIAAVESSGTTFNEPQVQEQPLELPQASAAPMAIPMTVSAPASAPQTPAKPKVPGAGTVVMTTTQTTWVNVLDKNDKEILNRHLAEGESVTISGAPPLKVNIGNATGMAVTYNGKPVDVVLRARSNVAHLTLE